MSKMKQVKKSKESSNRRTLDHHNGAVKNSKKQSNRWIESSDLNKIDLRKKCIFKPTIRESMKEKEKKGA